jgi:hypothetical protein
MPMILNAIAEKLNRQSKDDFKGRHFEAWLIVQAVTWYLRYPLSYRELEEMFQERGFEVDHSTINRWVLAYASALPAIGLSMIRTSSSRTSSDFKKLTKREAHHIQGQIAGPT